LVLIGVLFYQMKRELDGAIVVKVAPHLLKYNLVGEVVVVADAGSVLGRDLIRYLHGMNATVVMGCAKAHSGWCSSLSAELCAVSEADGTTSQNSECVNRLISLPLNLADTESIEQFSGVFHDRYRHLVIDYLVLNADAEKVGSKTTEQGHDFTFGTVHLGQLLLTQLLQDRLLASPPLSTSGANLNSRGLDNLEEFSYQDSKANSASRVVFVGSSSSMYGEIEPDAFTGSAAELFKRASGTSAAHFALTLNAFQLQKRLDELALSNQGASRNRRVVTCVVNSGFMDLSKSTLMRLVSRFVLRSVDESSHVVMYGMLSNNFVPSSYVDSYLIGHDLFEYHGDASSTHLVAFPDARKLKFNLPDPEGVFRSQAGNIEDWYFRLGHDKHNYRKLSEKLWKASFAVLGKDF
jgi:NAD(P)-dependent dehydrogenase (short-subunit alcohol dehydrogenase family)